MRALWLLMQMARLPSPVVRMTSMTQPRNSFVLRFPEAKKSYRRIFYKKEYEMKKLQSLFVRSALAIVMVFTILAGSVRAAYASSDVRTWKNEVYLMEINGS